MVIVIVAIIIIMIIIYRIAHHKYEMYSVSNLLAETHRPHVVQQAILPASQPASRLESSQAISLQTLIAILILTLNTQ